MKNLLIDIGNSNCKVAYHKNGELGEIFRSSQLATLDFILSIIQTQYFDVIVLSTVREDDPKMESVLEKKCRKLVVLNTSVELPIDLKYSFPPIGLGADRLAGALAVAMLFPGKDIIKFDFGTALTVDFINKDCVYEGGNISLGMQSRFRALNAFTKRLPLITPDAEFEPIGVNTTGAMTAGVVLGLKFEVEGYMNLFKDRIIVFTGGDSFYFAQKIKGPIFVVKNLVLLGLAQIADYYAEK